MARLRPGAVLLALLCASGCASPSVSTPQSRELADLAPLRGAYQDTVTGYYLRNPTTLIVSIDLTRYDSIDEDDDAALKAEAVKRWRDAWTREHPHEHATLTLQFVNYFNRPFFTQNIRV